MSGYRRGMEMLRLKTLHGKTEKAAAQKNAGSQKGQIVLFDFMIAMLLFVLIWFFLNARFDERLLDDSKKNSIELMRLKADYVLETLVKTQGSPGNWAGANMPLTDINSIGLAMNDRELSELKLVDFNKFTDYELLRQKLGIGEYDFYFSFQGMNSINAGLPPNGNASEVVAKRLVTCKADGYGYCNGGVGTATLKLYKLG